MDDEPSELTGKNFITYAGMKIEVEDPMNVQPLPADCITDLTLVDGTIWIALAHFTRNGDGKLKAIVNTRLRIPYAMTLDIQRFLEEQGAANEKAKKASN